MPSLPDIVDYDPRDPDVIDTPIPVLKHLQETDPVHWSERLNGWVITGYEDARRILTDEQISADRLTPFYEHQSRAMQQRHRACGDNRRLLGGFGDHRVAHRLNTDPGYLRPASASCRDS